MTNGYNETTDLGKLKIKHARFDFIRKYDGQQLQYNWQVFGIVRSNVRKN